MRCGSFVMRETLSMEKNILITNERKEALIANTRGWK